MTTEQVELLIKVITVLGAIIGIGKIIYDMITVGKSRLREDYKFAKEFLEEIKNNPELHPFAVEKGYHAIAGDNTLGFEEIAYLLSLKSPGQCLRDYTLAKKCLQTINTNGEFYLAFSKKYSSVRSRSLKKTFHLFFYVFWAAASIFPIFLTSKYVTLIVVTIPGFGYFALSSLSSYARIHRGEKLVKNQQKHTHRIGCIPHRHEYKYGLNKMRE